MTLRPTTQAPWLAAALAAALTAPAARAADGVTWEHTVEMQMQGFSMPAQTSRGCAPKDAMPDPPARKEDDCQVKDLKRTGKTVTWKMVCSGKQKMEGEGEMTGDADAYTGKMTARFDGQQMVMNMKGRRLGDPCDPGEQRRKVEAVVKQQQDQLAQFQAQACQRGVEELAADAFKPRQGLPPEFACRDPKAKADACARFQTREGFVKASAGKANGQALAELCGVDYAATRTHLCQDAQKRRDLGFLRESCPDQARAAAEELCAGREFCTLPPDERSFCMQFAADLMPKKKAPAQKAAQEEKPKSTKDEAVEQGKSLLKGLLGR